MKITDSSLDKAFKQTANNLEVPVGPELWDKFEAQNNQNSSAPILKLSLGIAASLVLLISASYLIFGYSSDQNTVIDLAASTSSEEYNSYKDYLKSDQYAQLRTSYEVIK